MTLMHITCLKLWQVYFPHIDSCPRGSIQIGAVTQSFNNGTFPFGQIALLGAWWGSRPWGRGNKLPSVWIVISYYCYWHKEKLNPWGLMMYSTHNLALKNTLSITPVSLKQYSNSILLQKTVAKIVKVGDMLWTFRNCYINARSY